MKPITSKSEGLQDLSPEEKEEILSNIKGKKVKKLTFKEEMDPEALMESYEKSPESELPSGGNQPSGGRKTPPEFIPLPNTPEEHNPLRNRSRDSEKKNSIPVALPKGLTPKQATKVRDELCGSEEIYPFVDYLRYRVKANFGEFKIALERSLDSKQKKEICRTLGGNLLTLPEMSNENRDLIIELIEQSHWLFPEDKMTYKTQLLDIYVYREARKLLKKR